MKGTLKLTTGIKIKSPSREGTRPSSSITREALINILRCEIEGSSWLDLCSGSGSISCEVLQYGARRILAIEKQKENAILCESNLLYIASKTNEKCHIQVLCGDIIYFLKNGQPKKKISFKKDLSDNDDKFDFIYFDPPYNKNIYTSALKLLISDNWIKPSSLLICECSRKNIPQIPELWTLTKKKTYGKSCLLFLTPNQASHYCDDIGSRH